MELSGFPASGVVEKAVVSKDFEGGGGEDLVAGMGFHCPQRGLIKFDLVALGVVSAYNADHACSRSIETLKEIVEDQSYRLSADFQRSGMGKGGYRHPASGQEHTAACICHSFGKAFGDDAVEAQREMGTMPFQSAQAMMANGFFDQASSSCSGRSSA